jgi:hypothetical protein
VKNLKRKVDMLDALLVEAIEKIKQLTNEVERLKIDKNKEECYININ